MHGIFVGGIVLSVNLKQAYPRRLVKCQLLLPLECGPVIELDC